MSKTPPAWSYSSIKLFDLCHRKYESERVTKEVKYTDSDATIYGKELHLACEEYIRDGKPVPPRFEFVLPYLKKLNAIPGEKICELQVGLKKEDGRFVACDFKDPDVWFRGVADLVIIDGPKGWLVDYKTNKNARYADPRQLALMAACLFAKYPDLERVKAGLLFVVSGDFIKSEYTRDKAFEIFADLHGLLTQREMAYNTNVWNPKPNGLCKRFCRTACPHNGSL
jgi:hypothetical protein